MYHSNVIRCFIWDLQDTSYGHSNRTSWIRTTETSWWCTTERSLGVSFEACLRRRGDVLMGRHCYVLLRCHHNVPIRPRGDVPLRRLGDVPPRRRWVFHLRRACDVAGRYREASLRHRHDVLLPGGFLLTIPFVLAFDSDMVLLYGNDTFSILVLSTKKRYSSCLKKVFDFQKI